MAELKQELTSFTRQAYMKNKKKTTTTSFTLTPFLFIRFENRILTHLQETQHRQ